MAIRSRSRFLAALLTLGAAPVACSGAETIGPPPATGCTTSDCPDVSNGGGLREEAGTREETGTPDEGGTIDMGASPDSLIIHEVGAADRSFQDQQLDDQRAIDDQRASNDNAIVADGMSGETGSPWDGGVLDEVLRLNDIQMEGSHNSYHIETTFGLIAAWAYTHKSLDVQLEMQGVRQFELDVHFQGPGDFRVHHVGPDAGTTCTRLGDCLSTMKTWSDAHPRHHPLVILVEQKDELDAMKISGHYDELEAAILAVWPAQRIITPDEVRGSRASLREAVTTDGWPTLGKSRGRVLFAFIGDSTEYMQGHPALEGRLIFPRATVDDPFAAVVLLDGAQGSETEITAAVRQGFLVRTRYNGEELRLNPDVVNAALRGGAHAVSGDFPQDFAITAGAPSRCNPVRAPVSCTAAAVEQL